MPRLNSRGDWCAGGPEGPVSINGVVVDYGSTPAWLWPDAIVNQGLGDHAEIRTCRIGGKPMLLDPRGASEIVADECGRWAAYVADGKTGTFGSITDPGARVLAGRNGVIALTDRDTNLGATLYTVFSAYDIAMYGAAYHLSIVDGTRAVWVPDQVGPLRACGMPTPKTCREAIWYPHYVNGWVIYETGDLGIVVHPADDAEQGFVIAADRGHQHNVDAVWFNGGIRVVYATSPAEYPEHVRVVDVDLGADPVDLRVPEPPAEPDPQILRADPIEIRLVAPPGSVSVAAPAPKVVDPWAEIRKLLKNWLKRLFGG